MLMDKHTCPLSIAKGLAHLVLSLFSLHNCPSNPIKKDLTGSCRLGANSASTKQLRLPARAKTDSENAPDNLRESKKIRKSHFTGCDVTIQNRKSHFTTCRSQNRIGKPTLQAAMGYFRIGNFARQPVEIKN